MPSQLPQRPLGVPAEQHLRALPARVPHLLRQLHRLLLLLQDLQWHRLLPGVQHHRLLPRLPLRPVRELHRAQVPALHHQLRHLRHDRHQLHQLHLHQHHQHRLPPPQPLRHFLPHRLLAQLHRQSGPPMLPLPPLLLLLHRPIQLRVSCLYQRHR